MNKINITTYKVFFLIGIGFFLTGQIILTKENAYIYKQEPIDFAHWFLLIGAVFLIPQTVSFPKKIFSYVGIPLTLIGIVCIIGMCVLDFIWWSFSTEEMRNEFTNHISQVPAIWKPFISIGPSSKIFNLGLLFLSLNYFEKGKVGIIILLLANLILWNIIPIPFRLVFGYTLTLISFSIVFFKKNFKVGKACIYVKKLADINLDVLEKLCKETIDYLNEHHKCACRN